MKLNMEEFHEELDNMAIEFCEELLGGCGISKKRIREEYVPIIKQLLLKAALMTINKIQQEMKDRGMI